MRRLWPVALLVILGAGLGGRAGSAEPGEVFLPDLRTLDPADFHISERGGRTLLLLTNTVWNGGDGPLEMRPQHEGETTYAFQLLFTEDDQGNIVQLPDEHPAGSFEFHPEHDHWHFQDLARYELAKMKADGSPGRKLATSEKISFCMFDQMQIDPTLENTTQDPYYPGSACDRNTNVGYSVGWGDEYAYNFADQDIDITGVSPGRYWVVSTADPEKLIEETNDDNNAAQTAVELRLEDRGEEDERMLVRTVTETSGSLCEPCGTTALALGTRYGFKGTTAPSPGPRPTYPEPAIVLSFKRAGSNDWRSFGTAASKRAFTLASGSDGSIDLDGYWKHAFVAHRKGSWVLRARYAGNENFTHSGVRTRVAVDRGLDTVR